MAKHSESAFDEAKEVRILSDVLESTHKIKTFFKENDRTPNHDGNFELVTNDGEPKKQFIVQIKKVSSLEKNDSGKNKGKYTYSLDTSFLYYVKEKVTESPAIYFVVDINYKRIFYLYLSDDKLMSLDFEGKEHVSYAFSDNEILSDIDSFYRELLAISERRNLKFLYKSSSEIAELQDAADYINNLFNGDFRIIKENCFPNLWRFGIGLTTSGQVEISCKDPDGKQVVLSNNSSANLFGLYPQYKGQTNSEIGEYRLSNWGAIIDCSGQGTPIEYTKRNVHSIIQKFCQNPPAKLLPSIALQERVYKRSLSLNSLYSSSTQQLLIDTLVKQFYCVLSYFDYLFFSVHEETDGEKQFKTMATNLLQLQSNCIDICNPFMMNSIKNELTDYYRSKTVFKFNPQRVFKLVSINTINMLIDILELQSRNIKEIHLEWENTPQIFCGKDINAINTFYSDYFAKLPKVYYEFYSNIFSRNNEYRFGCKVDYYLYFEESPYSGSKFSARINKYSFEEDQIVINNTMISGNSFTELEKSNGVISKTVTCNFCPSNSNQHLIYDGIRCWLYQGICNKLGFDIAGINLGEGTNETIF